MHGVGVGDSRHEIFQVGELITHLSGEVPVRQQR